MPTQNTAYVYKYNVEPVLRQIKNIPEMMNNFRIDPSTLVDLFILDALNSFEVCTFYPKIPAVSDPGVQHWIDNNIRAKHALWELVKIPPHHSGSQVAMVRLDNAMWLFFI